MQSLQVVEEGRVYTFEWTHSPAERRAAYGPGPWLEEPDVVRWWLDDTPCLALRSPSLGAWNGYVGLRRGHPWYGKDWEELTDVEVHGGLSYAGHMPEHAIIQSDLWWVGFTCAHAGDRWPVAWPASLATSDWVYRDLAYIRGQVEGLVKQARGTEHAGD